MLKKILLLILLGLFNCACKNSSDFTSQNQHININSANINIEMGLAYLKNKNFSQAKYQLLLATKQAPHYPAVWYSLAYFLEISGEKLMAEKYYLKAIRLDPKSSSAKNNYGAYLCRTGRYKAAITQFMLAAKNINYVNSELAYKNAEICALKIPDKHSGMASLGNKKSRGHFVHPGYVNPEIPG